MYRNFCGGGQFLFISLEMGGNAHWGLCLWETFLGHLNSGILWQAVCATIWLRLTKLSNLGCLVSRPGYKNWTTRTLQCRASLNPSGPASEARQSFTFLSIVCSATALSLRLSREEILRGGLDSQRSFVSTSRLCDTNCPTLWPLLISKDDVSLESKQGTTCNHLIEQLKKWSTAISWIYFVFILCFHLFLWVRPGIFLTQPHAHTKVLQKTRNVSTTIFQFSNGLSHSKERTSEEHHTGGMFYLSILFSLAS